MAGAARRSSEKAQGEGAARRRNEKAQREGEARRRGEKARGEGAGREVLSENLWGAKFALFCNQLIYNTIRKVANFTPLVFGRLESDREPEYVTGVHIEDRRSTSVSWRYCIQILKFPGLPCGKSRKLYNAKQPPSGSGMTVASKSVSYMA